MFVPCKVGYAVVGMKLQGPASVLDLGLVKLIFTIYFGILIRKKRFLIYINGNDDTVIGS